VVGASSIDASEGAETLASRFRTVSTLIHFRDWPDTSAAVSACRFFGSGVILLSAIVVRLHDGGQRRRRCFKQHAVSPFKDRALAAEKQANPPLLRYSPSRSGLSTRALAWHGWPGVARQSKVWLATARPGMAGNRREALSEASRPLFAIRRPRIPFQYLPVSVSTLAVQADV
jgi:hypothetical protein